MWEDVPTFMETEPPFPFLPMEQWVGERVVFKLAAPDLQKEFARGWYEAPDSEQDWLPWNRVPVRYEDMAGKTGIIREFLPDHDRVYVIVELDESGKRYAGKTKEESHWSLVFLRDVEAARQAFGGKTLWTMATHLRTDPDDRTKTVVPEDLEPVVVTRVAPGAFFEPAVRLFLRKQDGREGFYDVHVSHTNIRLDDISEGELSEWETFEGCFLTDNLRDRYPFTPEIWEAIDDYCVLPDMTPLQVILAYQSPDHVEKTAASGPGDMVYVYAWTHDGKAKSRRISFLNGCVVSDEREEYLLQDEGMFHLNSSNLRRMH